MIYIFRIEANLLDSTVFVTNNKKNAEKIIKQDYIKEIDLIETKKNYIKKMNCATYEELTGNERNFPAPYEIVEYGVVKRYKIKHSGLP
jgi:hypothetical protein